MKIFGLRKKNIGYEIIEFENVNLVNRSENDGYILNISDFLFETLKLVLLRVRRQQNDGQVIEFINEIDNLEDEITVESLVENNHSSSVTDHSFNLMNRIAAFLNNLGATDER